MCNGTPFTVEKILPLVGLEPLTARSVGQHLNPWATMAQTRALTPLFGNGAGAFRIGKNSVVLIKIGKKYKVLCIEVFIVRLI